MLAWPEPGDQRVAGSFTDPNGNQLIFIQEYAKKQSDLQEYEDSKSVLRATWGYFSGGGGIYWRKKGSDTLYKLHIEEHSLPSKAVVEESDFRQKTHAVILGPALQDSAHRLIATVRSEKIWNYRYGIWPVSETINEIDMNCPLSPVKACLVEDKAFKENLQASLKQSKKIEDLYKVLNVKTERKVSFVFENTSTQKRYVVDKPVNAESHRLYEARVWEAKENGFRFVGSGAASRLTTNFLKDPDTGKKIPLQKRGLLKDKNLQIVAQHLWAQNEIDHIERKPDVLPITLEGCGGMFAPPL